MTVMYGRGRGASKWDMDGLVGGSHHSDRLLAEAAPPETVHQLVPQEADTDSDVLACLSTPNTIHLDILFCHSNRGQYDLIFSSRRFVWLTNGLEITLEILHLHGKVGMPTNCGIPGDAVRAYSNFADYMELVVGVEGGGRGRGSVKAILRGLGEVATSQLLYGSGVGTGGDTTSTMVTVTVANLGDHHTVKHNGRCGGPE
ncbi:hypothetical protein B0H10DRAFT_2199764 [Mycena sp. CBHHK59/15]|nr:hypothetical protein B0H10DRAFT_2199764 [Mycena sp. CBHHK59/15]